MKIFLLTVTVIISVTFAADPCDPDSNGQPNCSVSVIGQSYRNFWDPVHYWVCEKPEEMAKPVRCPTSTLFSDESKQCISWKVWKWTDPCPELLIENGNEEQEVEEEEKSESK